MLASLRGAGLCYNCGPAAPPDSPLIRCGATCVDPRGDPAHCGACGTVCSSGVCQDGACLLVNRETCAGGDECVSGFCADGVCCDTACAGQCEACHLAGTEGTCTPASGQPVGGRPACAGIGSVCAGSGDGVNGAACAYPGGETVCDDPLCREGDQVTFACDGAGGCAETGADCGLYVCVDGACLATCADHSDCIGAAYCADGVCQGDKPVGQPCAGRDECQSGFCVDAVCCDSIWAGQCAACNVTGTEGTCTPLTGTPCDDGDACTQSDTCQAGACVGADPVVCQALDECHVAGSCDPGSGQCSHPPADAGTACGQPASCTNGIAHAPDTCDEQGTCVAGAETTCSPFVCGATACRTTCAADTDCIPSHHCDDGQCLPDAGLGAPCDEESDCQSGVCTAGGICCNEACAGECVECTEATGGVCTSRTDQACGAGATCLDGDTAQAGGTCTAQGTCQAGGIVECAPYLCNGGVCASTCAADADCRTGYHCDAPTCVLDVALGGACDEDSDCQSGVCNPVDNICCAEACDAGVGCGGAGFTCSCVPDCAGKTCGDDGCGGSCGTCDSDQCLTRGPAQTCVSTCESGQTCVDGSCQTTCAGTDEPCTQGDECCDGNRCTGNVCCPLDSGRNCGAVCCDAGLVCNFNAQCVPSCGQLNELCCLGAVCADGLVCGTTIEGGNAICIDACGDEDDRCCVSFRCECVSFRCESGLDCTLQGICTSNTCSGPGQPCCVGLRCDDGLDCDPSITCVEP